MTGQMNIQVFLPNYSTIRQMKYITFTLKSVELIEVLHCTGEKSRKIRKKNVILRLYETRLIFFLGLALNLILTKYQNKNIYCYSDLFFYTRKLYNKSFKPVFEYKITFWICVLAFWIHKSYFIVKKLVWNICIKAFWYSNCFLFIKSFTKIYLVLYNSAL